MKGVDWPQILLRTYGEDCIWHAIIPTILSGSACSWEKARFATDAGDSEMLQIQKSHTFCVLCSKTVGENLSQVSVRFTLGKRHGTIVGTGQPCFIYRAGLVDGRICHECIKTHSIGAHLDSDKQMIDIFLDHLEDCATRIAINTFEDLSGPEFWTRMVSLFETQHFQILNKMAQTEKKCAYCRIMDKNAKFCSGCKYYQYCSERCQKADWPLHRAECKALSSRSLFLKVIKVVE